MSSLSSSFWSEVILESGSSYSPKYGFKSEMLKVELTLNSGGNSSLYTLSFIFSIILKEVATLDINLDKRNTENLSFLMSNQTESPPVEVQLIFYLYY